MKSLCKISVAALLLISNGIIFAQVSTTANVAATVQDVLTLTKNTDVSFGKISATSTPILDANDQSHTDIGTVYAVGDYTISGTNAAQVTVSYDAAATLGDGTSATMTFTPEVVGDASSANQATAGAVTSGGQVTLGSSGFTLWLGGNLGTLTTQTTGTYSSSATNGSGDFTVTIEYN